MIAFESIVKHYQPDLNFVCSFEFTCRYHNDNDNYCFFFLFQIINRVVLVVRIDEPGGGCPPLATEGRSMRLMGWWAMQPPRNRLHQIEKRERDWITSDADYSAEMIHLAADLLDVFVMDGRTLIDSAAFLTDKMWLYICIFRVGKCCWLFFPTFLHLFFPLKKCVCILFRSWQLRTSIKTNQKTDCYWLAEVY